MTNRRRDVCVLLSMSVIGDLTLEQWGLCRSIICAGSRGYHHENRRAQRQAGIKNASDVRAPWTAPTYLNFPSARKGLLEAEVAL